MMQPLEVLILGLAVPGLLPALAVARRSPAVIFLAPIVGAIMAALAAELEVAVSLSLLGCYVLVAVTVNAAVIASLLMARRVGRRPLVPQEGFSLGWSILTVLIVLAALAFPLSGLQAHEIGWDADSIWLTHSLMLSGGHRELVTAMTDPAYRFANPDYPPLVPAVSALGFALFGQGNLYLAVAMTELVAACALGLVGTAIATVATAERRLTRVPAIAAGGVICIVGFAVAGVNGIDGYADLPWSAAAVAAVVFGLVLPKSRQYLVTAWICAVAASLTKNEGLITALAVMSLIALRYRPLTFSRPGRVRDGLGSPGTAAHQTVRAWAERGAFIVAPGLPCLIWVAEVRALGLRDAFFTLSTSESLAYRAGAAAERIGSYLTIAPVALAVLILGCIFLNRDRRRSGLGNPLWLWAACVVGLAAIFATYVFGSLEIHRWLAASVSRVTDFGQLVLYAELTIWFVIAFDNIFTRDDAPQRELAAAAGQRLGRRQVVSAQSDGASIRVPAAAPGGTQQSPGASMLPTFHGDG
jgi:hypothetical protein